MDRVQGLKTSCLSKFSECKQAQDAAVELTATCPASQTTMTTGAAMTTMAAIASLMVVIIKYNLKQIQGGGIIGC